MNAGMNSRGEPVTKPPHSLRWWEEHVVDHYGGKGNLRAVLQRSPMNEFNFGDGKSDPQVGTPLLDEAEKVLMATDIRPYQVRADC